LEKELNNESSELFIKLPEIPPIQEKIEITIVGEGLFENTVISSSRLDLFTLFKDSIINDDDYDGYSFYEHQTNIKMSNKILSRHNTKAKDKYQIDEYTFKSLIAYYVEAGLINQGLQVSTTDLGEKIYRRYIIANQNPKIDLVSGNFCESIPF